jgi:hypothetical protein
MAFTGIHGFVRLPQARARPGILANQSEADQGDCLPGLCRHIDSRSSAGYYDESTNYAQSLDALVFL